MIGIGAGIGAVLLGMDQVLKARGTKFRLHLMPIAVGMYLPFGLATPILVGGIISHFVTRGSRDDAQADRRTHRGVLLGSGVIAGEALIGVAAAGLTVKELWLSLEIDNLPGWVPTTLSVGAMLGFMWLFYRVAMAGRREADQRSD